MLKTDLFPCPANCGKHHALCWLHRVKGKVLGVNCDSDGRMGHTTFRAIPANLVENMAEDDLQNLPEYYTPEARKRLDERSTPGMNLMYVQPGQTVERNVALPRKPKADEPQPSNPEDAAKAEALKLELAQLAQAQKEIITQSEKLAALKAAIDRQETEARKSLREVWTERLDFTPND